LRVLACNGRETSGGRTSKETMPPMLNPDRARIFRITHRDNVPWILDNGLHAPAGQVLDPNFKNIGNIDLIGKSAHRIVGVGPRGTLSDYVRFYFTPFSIMMFNIHTGYNVPQVPNEEIVILVSSLHRVADLGIPFVFTDQHAYPVMANYFSDLKDLDRIDWDLLNRRDFQHNPDDPGKKERYQAEALIWKHLPVQALLGICCYTAAVEEWINAELAKRKLEMQTIVQRSWYFQ
jgi:ssDNA thymidine ADP-ribosyltransferase, DarT